MGLQSLNTIKNWFKTNFVPTQDQFWDMFDSFRHKSDKVAATDVDGLNTLLAAKASAEVLTAHTTAVNAHATLFGNKVDKVTGKGLSDQNYSLPEKEKLAGIEDWVDAQIAGVVVGSTNLGALTPLKTIPATINIHGFATEAGTYANCGDVVVPANSYAFISRVDGAWSISVTGFDISSKVNVSDVIDSVIGKNKFDKTDIISGLYISSGDGSLISHSPSKLSNWIAIDMSKLYCVTGRTASGLRFKDSSGAILQPYNSSGVAVTNWDAGYPNGVIYCPPTAVALQMTLTLDGSGDINTIQLEEGNIGTAYSAYIISSVFKKSLIPDLDVKVDYSYLMNRINLFDKTNIIAGKYVSTIEGKLESDATSAVSSVIPIIGGTIYYLQGRSATTGEMVFYDNSGVKLKPYSASGIEFPTFSPGFINGAVMSPPTAISVQFTIRFVGSGEYDAIMFSQSAVELPYKNYFDFIIKESLLPLVSEVNVEKFKIIKATNSITVRTLFDSVYDIICKLDKSAYLNGLYNISEAKLLLLNESDAASGVVLNGSGGDDSAPSWFNGTILGGNHGSPSFTIVANSHGKTLADVGAKYTDSLGNYFTIIKIIDSNNLQVGVKNISITDTWTFPNPVTPLTYNSSGSSTTVINFTSPVSVQLSPAVKNVVQKLIVDGVEKTENGTYYGEKVNIIETYDIIDYPDMLEKLTTNRPSGGYLTQPVFTNGNAIISVTNVFNIQPKGTIALVNTWSVEKQLYFDMFGISQNGYSTPSWATTCRRYFPKTLPITNNGNTFDFRLKPEFKTPVITDVINITSEYWESGKPVNRVIDLLESSTLNINFNLGYLPLGGNRLDLVTNAWLMTSSKKLYPRYIDGKIGTANVVPIGTIKQGVAFRGWSKPNGIRTNDFLVENGGKHYLYLDYHSTGTDTIELPSCLIGKEVSVIDKSSNVELITSIVTGNVKVKIAPGTPMYGYCELLIQ